MNTTSLSTNPMFGNKKLQTPIEIALGIDEDGKTTARKLFDFLGMHPKNFARWCKTNITENPYAEENVDFWAFFINEECGGQSSTDYILTAHFAKKLSMVQRTERGEEAREYFAKVEKRAAEIASLPTTPQGQIQLLAQGIVEMQEQINTVSDTVEAVKSDFDTFKEDCPLFPVDMDRISQTARKKGVEVMGGKSSMAYHDRSIVQMVYRDIYGELHRNFGCRSYKEIARKNIDKAVDVIERYTLPMFLMEKVDKTNAMI